MPILSVDNISLHFGERRLLDGVSFMVNEGDKIAFIGNNGAGKSTLFKIIKGTMSPDDGKVIRHGNTIVGFLSQNMDEQDLSGSTLKPQKLIDVEERKTVLEYEIAAAGEDEGRLKTLMDEYSKVTAEYEAMGGYDYDHRMADALAGLGLTGLEDRTDLTTLSGGEKMRVCLAQLIVAHPDILMLDEPTNHLDIEAIEWLEDYLKNKKVSLLLVSHDRKFLDNVTNRTVEIMLGHVHDYKVPYSQYVELRKERISQQTAAYENQQRMIEKTEDFINRFRYKPTKSNQVQSRIKALEKIERIEIDETDVKTMHLKFPPAPRSGDVVYKASDITVGYPQKVVFRNADIEIKRGEKVAFIGRNGEGKTTLMRVIMGELDPFSGESKVGHNVDIGYFAQNQEDVLDRNDTVFGTLDRIAVGDIRTKLRDILGAFLFKGEDIDKKVSVLSGGERARLGMAKLMLQSHNLLALDEPTNHMDIQSKDILKAALKS